MKYKREFYLFHYFSIFMYMCMYCVCVYLCIHVCIAHMCIYECSLHMPLSVSGCRGLRLMSEVSLHCPSNNSVKQLSLKLTLTFAASAPTQFAVRILFLPSKARIRVDHGACLPFAWVLGIQTPVLTLSWLVL